jgi:hypothetical protein
VSHMELPPVVADDRDSLRAHTLATVPRLDLLSTALRRQRQHASTEGRRQALVLVGDGGMGKSVLLGQLLDHIEAHRPDQPSEETVLSSGSVVLVSCATIASVEALSGVNAVDELFGRAADSAAKYSNSLFGLLSVLKARYKSVTLLIDTLDLLISESSLPALATFIALALDVGDVVLTCRAHEFDNYLADTRQSAPRLAHRLTKVTIPRLDPHEIVDWAQLYLARSRRKQIREEAGFIRALRGGVEQNGSLRQVCSVPVRLALTCETFAATGHVPEDLTVTGLYDAYWDQRVHRQTGRADTADSNAKEHAALAVASRVVTSTGNIVLQVPKGQLSPDDKHGLRLLASEGVLRDLRTSWEFFHQTFAEYSHGRWLLTQGVDCEEIVRLGSILRSGQTKLWPVANSLMLQVPDYSGYLALRDHLPIVGPEGARVHALAALRRPEPDALNIFLAEVQPRADLMLAVLPALSDAPIPHLDACFDAALRAIQEHPAELSSTATATLAFLLPRIASADLPQRLTAALNVLQEVRANLDLAAWNHLPATLLRSLADLPDGTVVLPVICDGYAQLGTLGRQVAIREHLQWPLSLSQTVAFARCALSAPCPPLNSDETFRVLELSWNCSQVRGDREWGNWRDVLADDLPKGWGNAQVELIVHLANRDESVRTEVVNDLLSGNVRTPVAHVNVLKKLVAVQPQWTAEWLLSHPTPTDPLAIGGIAEGAEGFTKHTSLTTRLALMAWLAPGRGKSPRAVWPAQIILAAESIPAHQQIFDDLIAANEPQQVIDSAVDAWLFQTPRHVVNEMTEQFRMLLQGISAETRRTRARLEGRIADVDEKARDWIKREVLQEPSPRVAGTAIKTIADAADRDATELSHDMVAWLTTLLPTPHTDAAQRIARLLSDQRYVSDETLISATSNIVSTVLNRMRLAIEQCEDSQLARQLLDLLIRTDRIMPLTPEQVRVIYTLTRSRLSETLIDDSKRRAEDQAAGLRDLAHLTGTLMAQRLTAAEVRGLLEELFSSVDPGRFGRKVGKAVSAMLIGLAHRDPQAINWMEDIFGRPAVSVSVRLAVAIALLQLDGNHIGGRASRLKDRPDCPPNVATYIINRLHE